MDRDFVIERLSSRITPLESREFGSRGDHDLNPGMAPPDQKLTPAAVLVPLVDRADELTVLLTQRTEHLRDHAGQVSFPGGRIEPNDPSHEAAALREAEEEVGLPSDRVDLIGRLDRYVTRTGFEVVPVIGIVNPPFPIRPDPFEVAEVFEVPLRFLADPKTIKSTVDIIKVRGEVFMPCPTMVTTFGAPPLVC